MKGQGTHSEGIYGNQKGLRPMSPGLELACWHVTPAETPETWSGAGRHIIATIAFCTQLRHCQ